MVLVLKKKLKLSDEQRKILNWLIVNQQATPYLTWKIFFMEKENPNPDPRVFLFDNLSFPEKSEVELVLARYFSRSYRTCRVPNDFETLLYEE